MTKGVVVDPERTITDVGWPSDKIYGLLSWRNFFFAEAVGRGLSISTWLGVTPRVERVAPPVTPPTFLPTIGSFATTDFGVISDPPGYHSYYLGATYYHDNGPYPASVSSLWTLDPPQAGPPGGSVFIGSEIRDLTSFNAVWENGTVFRFEAGQPDFGNRDSLIYLSENEAFAFPDGGSYIFDVRSYAVVNLGKIIADQTAAGAIANVKVEITGMKFLQPPTREEPSPIQRDTTVSWRVYQEGVFKGAGGRIIVNEGGTLLPAFSEDVVIPFASMPDPPTPAVLHTFHYDVS